MKAQQYGLYTMAKKIELWVILCKESFLGQVRKITGIVLGIVTWPDFYLQAQIQNEKGKNMQGIKITTQF